MTTVSWSSQDDDGDGGNRKTNRCGAAVDDDEGGMTQAMLVSLYQKYRRVVPLSLLLYLSSACKHAMD